MASNFKPDGYSTVSPYLIVDGANEVIDFLIAVFDAAELQRHLDPNGRIVHAEVRLDDTVIMLSEGSGDWPPVSSSVYVYVADVDATYQRALAAGAESIQAPTKHADPDRRGGVKDAGGTFWWIATKVE